MADDPYEGTNLGSGAENTLPAVIDAEFHELVIHRPPDVVLEEARKAARVLNDVIGQKPRKVMFNDEQYLELEDWQTVARFYGCSVKVESTQFVSYDLTPSGPPVCGFEAVAVVLTADGREISRAEAMCLNDEEKWSTRTKYEWCYVLKDGTHSAEDPGTENMVWEPNPNRPGKNRPKKERVTTGSVAVPLFQLRSMAQTRAAAKALRLVFSWVVVLAGYRPTPAEEIADMPGARTEERGSGNEAAQPEKAARTPPTQSQGHSEPRQGNGNGGTRAPDEKAKLIQAIVALAEEHVGAEGLAEVLPLWSRSPRTDGGDDMVLGSREEMEKVGVTWLRKTKMSAEKWVAMGLCQHCGTVIDPTDDVP